MEVQSSECAEDPLPPPPLLAAAEPTQTSPCDPHPPPPPQQQHHQAPSAPAAPTGNKINKAAFKLFGKRRSGGPGGSGMAGFFSFRNKAAAAAASGNNNHHHGENNGSSTSSSSVVELIRSKTHDGLGGAEGAVEAGAVERGGREVGTVRSSLSKSFSFFSLLRRGSLRAAAAGGGDNGGGGAGLVGRRGRGLKGLFSSMRWRRSNNKDKSSDGTVVVAVLEVPRRSDEQNDNKDITLTLEPQPQHAPEDHGNAAEEEGEGRRGLLPGMESASAVAAASPHLSREFDSSFPYTPTDSPVHAPHPHPHPPLPILSSDKTNTKTSSVSSSYSPPPSATPPLDGGRVGELCGGDADPPSEPSVDRLCSLLFTDVTSLKSFDSLTGCGDIIADADGEEAATAGGGGGTGSAGGGGGGGGGGGNGSGTSSSSSGGERPLGGAAAATSCGSPCKPPLPSQIYTAAAAAPISSSSLPSRARVVSGPSPTPPPPQQQHHHPSQTGSGVVAYMGGGEEMASPDGVDDADMQGLWHMLPSTGDNSPALPPRSHQTPSTPASSSSTSSSNQSISMQHHRGAAAPRERGTKPPQVKALGLSKIPVVGGGGGGGGSSGSRGSAAAKPPLPHGAQRHVSTACTSPPGGDKEPLSDEGYWDTPSATPTATPDEGVQPRGQKMGVMSRDSCSGDHLYDLYNDPEEGEDGGLDGAEDDLACSSPSPTTEYKLSPPSVTTPPSSASEDNCSFRSMKGSASLPRESKIPISVVSSSRTSTAATPPHSVSQSALSSSPAVVEASVVDQTPTKTTEVSVPVVAPAPVSVPAPARTRIPVSKVPVRRSAGATAAGSRGHRK